MNNNTGFTMEDLHSSLTRINQRRAAGLCPVCGEELHGFDGFIIEGVHDDCVSAWKAGPR